MAFDHRDFDRQMRNHEKTFDRMFKFIFVIVICVFVAVFAFWGFVGYTIISTAQDPKGEARSIGEVVKEFEKGYSQ